MSRHTATSADRPSASRMLNDSGVHTAGTAALELVVVLPVLMVIVIGATDLSRVLYYENVLTNAARTGAAYGATHQVTDYTYDDWESRVVAEVVDEAAHVPGHDPDLIRVAVSRYDEADGSQRVQVEASYPFELLIDWPGWPSQLTLRRSVSMRVYR